jgi:hypothetical protein
MKRIAVFLISGVLAAWLGYSLRKGAPAARAETMCTVQPAIESPQTPARVDSAPVSIAIAPPTPSRDLSALVAASRNEPAADRAIRQATVRADAEHRMPDASRATIDFVVAQSDSTIAKFRAHRADYLSGAISEDVYIAKMKTAMREMAAAAQARLSDDELRRLFAFTRTSDPFDASTWAGAPAAPPEK